MLSKKLLKSSVNISATLRQMLLVKQISRKIAGATARRQPYFVRPELTFELVKLMHPVLENTQKNISLKFRIIVTFKADFVDV